MKVAIVGLSPSHTLAPWNDPAWQKWGLGWDVNAPRMDRVFEMHDDWREVQVKGYESRLRDCPRLYMQRAYLPHATVFPFDEVAQDVGDYWNSSLAYALSLAIHEKAEEIGLYGIDMKGDDEYGYQKPNMEYLIGLARGRGIKVHIPEQSPLCKYVNPINLDYAGRYGRSK